MGMLNALTVLAQNNGDVAAGAAAGIIGVILLLLYIAIVVLIIAGFWKVFTKAGKPGWAAIVPIYNMVVLIDIAGRPLWWIILMLIPLVNLIVWIIVLSEISKRFGRGVGTTIGLILLPAIFFPILGFGSAQYQGAPAAQ